MERFTRSNDQNWSLRPRASGGARRQKQKGQRGNADAQEEQ
jgi:hypothetical protein